MPDLSGAAEVHACPSCNHPWTAHGTDGCAYAEPGGCWCANTGAASRPAPSYFGGAEHRRLVEQALHLCQHGERAPGSGPWPAETWPEWARRAEEWLRAEPVREPVDVAGLVSDEMVQRAAHAESVAAGECVGKPFTSLTADSLTRAALISVAADLYERGREDGRGDLIWHEERVRRECAATVHGTISAVAEMGESPEVAVDDLRAKADEWAGQEET